jgi:hypothetical protein
MLHTMAAVLAATSQTPPIDLTGSHVADTAKTAIGNLFIVVLAILGAIALWRRKMLEVVGLAALAVACAVFVYFPNTIQAIASAVVRVVEGQ